MKALILVDLQNDFMPGGALAVNGGDELVERANTLMLRFDLVVASQDWHPSNHGSFASQHEGKNVGDIISLNGVDQILWVDHCVRGTSGAEFKEGLNIGGIDKIFQKGIDKDYDSYSAFFDNDHKKSTGLTEFFNQEEVTSLHVMGLATDYCVKYTALDAVKSGFECTFYSYASKGVNLNPDDTEFAIKEMQDAGVLIIN